MIRFLRAIIATTFVVGGLVVASMTAFAVDSPGTTALHLTIPVTISMSGLAASYSVEGAAGNPSTFDTGPVNIQTNDANGYTLTVQSTSSVFQGVTSSNTFPIADDSMQVLPINCPAGDTCPFATPLTTNATTVASRTTLPSASGDNITVRHIVTPPASQHPDTYSDTLTYDAVAN